MEAGKQSTHCGTYIEDGTKPIFCMAELFKCYFGINKNRNKPFMFFEQLRQISDAILGDNQLQQVISE